MSDTQIPLSVRVAFTIASSTPHSGKYAPENIMEDKPADQSSRWSGAFQGNASQWIVLKLECLSILKTITFGKFSKAHPCNMKELKVFVGTSEEHMNEVLHAGLKNDNIPETFLLNHANSAGVPFPTRYVKIVPILAHGQNFHISIWHVNLSGITDPEYVERVRLAYDEHRETAVVRYVLKHLRQRRLLSPYQSILTRSNIHLEHPLITKLHDSIVLQGDWSGAEQLLDEMSTSGLYKSFLHSCQPFAEWTRLSGTDADGDVPPARGGHAMCMDPVNENIYIFGGWNGEKSLDDFWVYSIQEDKWRILSHSTTQEQNAPGARSCHKMVFDTKTGCIYVLGRLNDSDGLRAPATSPAPTTSASAARTRAGHAHPTNLQRPQQDGASAMLDGAAPPPAAPVGSPEPKPYYSEFYRYHTRGLLSGKWDYLSVDTAASGGPPLVFDHQMVMDSDAQTLYVFGGRVVDGDWDIYKYSGLYSYNVSTSKWRLLQPVSTASSSTAPTHALVGAGVVGGANEVPAFTRQGHTTTLPDASIGSVIIPPRSGHSMVLDPATKNLYIFAGQREDKYLSDMYAYDIKTGSATEIFTNFSAAGGPEACFTQRAVVDPTLKEIYVFCGLTRTNVATPSSSSNSNSNTSSNSSASGTNASSSSTSRAMLKDSLLNWVYKYDSRPGSWMQILRMPERSANQRPMPRFAHQVVYNSRTRMVYLHGGNAGGAAGSRVQQEGGPAGGNAAEVRGDAGERQREGGSKERLDDFWRMELKRPGPQEIIRQSKFLIRKQQFREMCEETSPVKALNFLQKDVSTVVDHKDRQEEEQFRGLLTHLLSPPPQPVPVPIPTAKPSISRRQSTISTSSSALEHEDTREGSPRPRKRSRPDKEREEDSSSVSSEDGAWTNEVPSPSDAEASAPAGEAGPSKRSPSNIQYLRDVTDPLEASYRSDRAGKETGKEPPSLTGARYAQRTEVFEGLLRFVDEAEKQPEESLLDLVESDKMGRGLSFLSGL